MNILLAIFPLLIAVFLLAVLQRSGLQAGLITLVAAMAITIAIPSFHLTPINLLIALGQGIALSLTVLTVLFPALLLYHLLHGSGAMAILARGVTHLCPNRDLQVLLLVLGFAPFVESVSGFGVGTVVIIPMLASLDIDPLRVATLGLLGQITVPWGALAVGTVLGAELTGVNPGLLGADTALITALLPFGFALVTLAISGGKQAVKRWWPAALTAGIVLVAGEVIFSQVLGLELTGVFVSVLTLVVLVAWSYRTTSRHSQASQQIPATPVNSENAAEEHMPGQRMERDDLSLWQGMAPYLLLTAFLLVTRLIVPLRSWFQNHAVLAASAINLNFPLLYTPGFWVLMATLISVAILRMNARGLLAATLRTWGQFLPGAVAILSFLATAQLMLASGMMGTLGSAAATLGDNYAWVAPWLAALGGWITGSNAGSNAIFALLQKEASRRTGLPLIWLMAAQNGAGSIATMVSPARTVLATTAANIPGKEGSLLRKLGPLVLAAIAIIMLLLIRIIM